MNFEKYFRETEQRQMGRRLTRDDLLKMSRYLLREYELKE